MISLPYRFIAAWTIALAAAGFTLDAAAQRDQQIIRNQNELGRNATPEGLGASSGPINIDYDDVPLVDFIASMATQLGINVEMPTNVQGGGVSGQNITIIATEPVPAEYAFDLFQSILNSRQHTLVETIGGSLYKIVPQVQAGQPGGARDKFPLFIGGATSELQGHDDVSTHVVTISYANPEDLVELLSTVSSSQANIVAYPQTGMLVITDTADGLRNMFRLIKNVDVPGYSTTVEIFALEYSRAEAIVTQVEEVLLGGDTGSGQGGTPQIPQRAIQSRRPTTAVPGQPGASVVGSVENVLRMVPDERLNAVIAVATPGLMEEVRFLIQELDTPTPEEGNNMHYVALENADATEVAEVLDALTSTAPRQGSETGGPSGEVQPFEKTIIISVYEPSNSLLILASAQDFKLLKSMIDRLDVPARLVNIEAMIMQAQLNDGFQLSVETAVLSNDDAFALTNATNIANAIVNGPVGLAGPGGVLGILDGTVDITGPDGGTIQVPNIPLLLRAVETLTDLEILSKPNLLTVDNEEASINVGDEVPIIASQGDVDDRTGFNTRSRVDRRQTGVTLLVTPQINQGDNVRMEIEVEVSQVAESTVGIDPNETGATISQSVVKNVVVVGDGQTGIIGGLIQANRTENNSQVPVLGDLPVIGFLFRNKSKSRGKQNLVVLVTPYIIRKSEDLTRITDYRVQEYYQERMDVIFDEDLGFIKRTQRKFEERDKRPTDQYDPARGTTKGGYRRGDIRR